MNQDVSRVMFPLEETEKEGYLIGFNQNGFNVTVIHIDSVNNVESA